MQELIDAKLVHPAGVCALERRSENKSSIYAYENRHHEDVDGGRPSR